MAMAPNRVNWLVWLASLVGGGVGVVLGAVEPEAEPVLLLAAVEDEAALGLAAAVEPGLELAVGVVEEPEVEIAVVVAVEAPALDDEVVESVPFVAALNGPMMPPCA
jgi:hypothetical protein